MSQFDHPTVTPGSDPATESALEQPAPAFASEAVLTLHVSQIRAYEHNPRHERNAAFHEMKASIRATRGLVNKLTVTRRPGQEHFIISAGGNTRLEILQELWEETRDDVFGYQTVIVEPWVSEISVFSKHMIENRKRSDMSFWDSARGCVFLRKRLEEEAGVQLSLRKLVQAFERIGYAVGRSMLHQYEFAVEYLEPIHPWLTSDITKQLQPQIGEWVRLAAVFGIEARQLHEDAIQPALRSYAFELVSDDTSSAANGFSVRTLSSCVHAAVAARLSVSPEVAAIWLDVQRARSDVSQDELLATQNAPLAKRPRHPTTDGQSSLAAEQAGSYATQSDGGRSVEALVGKALELARSLAASTGCVDMVIANAVAPAGFYVEVGGHAGECPDPYLRDAVWWTLAQLSGQLYPDVLHSLPEHSAWRNMMGAVAKVGLSQVEIDSALFQTQARFDPITRQPLIFTDYLPLVLFHQVGLAPVFSSLVATVANLQQSFPERFAFARRQYLFSVKED